VTIGRYSAEAARKFTRAPDALEYGMEVSLAEARTLPHIRVGDAPHFLLPLPPMEQQTKIVTELDALQSKTRLGESAPN
jgi:hypothetical protein